MKVMIKDGTNYKKVELADLLRGVGQEGEVQVGVKLPLHSGIVKIDVQRNGYKVLVHEKNINRVMNVQNLRHSALGAIKTRYIGITSDINGGISDAFSRVASRYLTANGLVFKTRKGVYLSLQLRKRNGEYIVDIDNARMSREIGDRGTQLLYPNLYEDTKMCWGTTRTPVLKDLTEVGKVASTYFTADSNNDLSTVSVIGERIIAMYGDLMQHIEYIAEGDRAAVTNYITAVREVTRRGRSNVNIYYYILLANLFGLDIDWMQDKLFGN